MFGLIQITLVFAIAFWFRRTARKRGRREVLWAVAGIAAYVLRWMVWFLVITGLLDPVSAANQFGIPEAILISRGSIATAGASVVTTRFLLIERAERQRPKVLNEGEGHCSECGKLYKLCDYREDMPVWRCSWCKSEINRPQAPAA
jgi:hypothetical protein